MERSGAPPATRMSEWRPAEKPSSFSVTCNRLSQYLKVKGSLADLGLGIAPRPHEPSQVIRPPPTTMSLLPGVDVSAGDQTDTKEEVYGRIATKSMELFPGHTGFSPAVPADDGAGKRADFLFREPEKAQLTMFYGGKVLVFDNFPADKAKDLMQLASQGCSASRNFVSATPSSTTSAVADCPPAAAQDCPPRPAPPSASDLPIARRASLHRFLEKRKDRVNSKAPYQVMNDSTSVVAPAKPNVAQPWLGLGQQVSKPALSYESSR